MTQRHIGHDAKMGAIRMADTGDVVYAPIDQHVQCGACGLHVKCRKDAAECDCITAILEHMVDDCPTATLSDMSIFYDVDVGSPEVIQEPNRRDFDLAVCLAMRSGAIQTMTADQKETTWLGYCERVRRGQAA